MNFLKIKMTVLNILKLLVNNEYESIEQFTNGIRLQAVDIKEAIDSYGRTLIMPPDTEYENLIDIIEISNSIPKKWSIRFDLWTREEGKSDLSLEMTLIESNNELMNVEFDDIHVL
jgi:hypothetical protein